MVDHEPAAPGPAVARLRLLASAIAGRPLDVAEAGPGEPSWTDGATVSVDPDLAPDEQVRRVAVQAALLAAGSLAPDLVRPLAGRQGLARRYLAIEGARALAVHEHLLPPVVRPLVDRTAAAGTAPDSLAAARVGRTIADPPPAYGEIRPRRLLAAAETTGTGGAVPPPALGVRPPAGGTLPDLDEGGEDEDGMVVGHLLSSPVGGQGPLGRLLRRLLGPARSPGGGGPSGADAPTHTGRARTVGRGVAASSRGPDKAPAVPAAFAPRARTYPEWDVHRRRYRPDWCTVHEHDPGPGDLAPLALPDGAALRRPLARLGTGLDRTHRRPQGDDLDIDAAVEARVATRAGTPADEAVYVESLRTRRDLSVLILLDVSGSAAEPGAGGWTVHEHQRAAAAGLTTALHDLGDRVALYAFRSQGRTAVHVTRVKGFDDRLDGRVAARLGGLVPAAYTRLGAAIRHGAATLEARGGTPRRLLVVVSDGFAYDHGYAGAYGEADAPRALAEARRRGLGCLCVTVGAATPPVALRRVFGPAAHVTVPAADRLPGLIGPLFRTALDQRRTP